MTGITLPSSVACKPRKDETAQQRYQTHLKPVAERYSIVQLGICLFHQHPDYDPINNPRSPEFIVVCFESFSLNAGNCRLILYYTICSLHFVVKNILLFILFNFFQRRYNFFMFPSGESYHGKSVPPPSREVVLNPSSIAFLNQHRMDFSTWMQAGIPYALETQAHEYIHGYLKARQRDLQQQQQQQHKDVGCSVSVATGAGQPHQNAAASNTNNAASTSSSTPSGRIELHRTEDIQFFARTMASLREWLDAAHSQSPHLHHRQRRGATHRGVAGVDDNVDDAVVAPAEVVHDPADEDGILEPHGPEVLNQEHHHHHPIEAGLEPSLLDGTSFLLPPCNSFLRRALYENIHLEYPALMLESAGPSHPNQIRVWRLNEEERVQRQEQLEREAWEKLIVDKLGMWRIFHALSNANRGIREEHSVASAVSWTTVPATTPTTSATTSGHYQIPIVVHNGLMDILFLMTHFVQWQLPSSYVDFKQLVHSHFPLVYDTKLMSTECCSSNTLFHGGAVAGAAAMPANIHNNNVNNNINEDDGNMANPNNSNHTPASSTVLANLYNKVIVRPGMGFKFQFAPDVTRSVYYSEPEHYQPHQEETEQLHQASYDAYMTGAVFVGLCQAIIQEREYVYDETLCDVLSEQQVGSLRFLLSPQPCRNERSSIALEEVDDQIKWLFGRNKVSVLGNSSRNSRYPAASAGEVD